MNTSRQKHKNESSPQTKILKQFFWSTLDETKKAMTIRRPFDKSARAKQKTITLRAFVFYS